MSSNEADYYSLLEVDSRASVKEIKKAFHRLAFIHHPDRNFNDSQANERFREINLAYQVLVDSERRFQYDQRRTSTFFVQEERITPFIYAEVDKTFVKRNEEVEITFAFGSEGRFFKKPEIAGCYITSGPIVKHRIKNHQGVSIRETLLNYTLCPLITGNIFIPPASISFDKNKYSSNDLQLTVDDNNCFYKNNVLAGTNPLKVFLNCQRVTSNTVYQKTIVHQRTVLIPRSDLVAWYHKVGRTMKISFSICGVAWAMIHDQSIILGFLSGSLFAGINCTLMYWMMGIKSVFYYSLKYPVLKVYLKNDYALGVSPSNSVVGNRIWYLFKSLFS